MSAELKYEVDAASAGIAKALDAIERAQRAAEDGLVLGGLAAAELDVRAAQRRLANIGKWLAT